MLIICALWQKAQNAEPQRVYIVFFTKKSYGNHVFFRIWILRAPVYCGIIFTLSLKKAENNRQQAPKGGKSQMKYACIICGYTYDEDEGDTENGIEPGTLWDDLPDDFSCPECGVKKEEFEVDTF